MRSSCLSWYPGANFRTLGPAIRGYARLRDLVGWYLAPYDDFRTMQAFHKGVKVDGIFPFQHGTTVFFSEP